MSELITTPSDLRVVTASPSAAPNVGSVLQRVRSFTQQAAVAKAMPAIGLVAVLGLAALLWAAFSSPPQRDLFRGLADADKGAVAEALQSAGIAYEVDRGTGALTVSDSQYYEAKMLLAQQGLPKSAPDGDALMSSMPMGASRAVESERLRGSRELDLARTIEAIDAVQSARVHLAVEQPSVFLRDQKQAAASVMLKLNGGRSLTENQVQAITNLVASSVPGLSPEAVSIVDQAGRLLSRAGGDPAAAAADRQLSLQAQIEQRYADSLDKLLTPLVGAGNYTAEVHADLDFSEVQATRESYPKDLAVVRAEQGGWTKDGGPDGLATGIPGALSNTPPAATTVTTAPDQTMLANGAPAAGTAAAAAARTTENYNRTFELGREVSVTKKPVGSVRRLSVAVALKDEKGAKRSKAELAALEQLVKGAVGYDAQRGDQIALSARSFAAIEEVKAPWYEASWMPMLTRNLSALLIAALLIFGIGRPLLKARAARKAAEPASDGKALSNGANAGAGRAAPAGGAVTLDMIENAPGYAARAELIRNFVKQDPARAALVVSDLIKADTQSESRNG